jgi:hypothetical protein
MDGFICCADETKPAIRKTTKEIFFIHISKFMRKINIF